ncbi:MAG: hypothetical protein ACYC5O_16480 [Anaerolineae bacterium]
MPFTDADKHDLAELLDDWEAGSDALAAFLARRSNLPGPRGNLEMADGFAATVEERACSAPQRLWSLVESLASLSAAEAPVNDPREFVAFCGVRGIAAVAAADASRVGEALERLRQAAADPRWRLREAVAMGLQRLLAVAEGETLAALESWVDDGGPLQWRAVVAGLAEPSLLGRKALAERALALHERVLSRVATAPDRRAPDFKALRQGLGYTLSVVVAALPEPGFALMRRLAASADADVRWIVAENLKKNRLVKPFPAEVASVCEGSGTRD